MVKLNAKTIAGVIKNRPLWFFVYFLLCLLYVYLYGICVVLFTVYSLLHFLLHFSYCILLDALFYSFFLLYFFPFLYGISIIVALCNFQFYQKF